MIEHRIVPLASPSSAAQTEALLEGLVEGGIPVIEIAFRNAYAERALRDIAADGRILAGAGTVLNEAQARHAVDLGARFLVSPGLNEGVVRVAQEKSIPVFPGVATPTEVMQAKELGCTVLKVFPANVLGGLNFVSALHAVFPDLRFMPSGGVSQQTLAEHLSHPAVQAVSGTWMTSNAILDQGAGAVASLVRAARETADAA